MAKTAKAKEEVRPATIESEVDGITIRKGKTDYKFYKSNDYVGALGGDNVDDEAAVDWAKRLARKLAV